MINTNTVKAILAFYLQVKFKRWGLATDENMKLPTDEKNLNKVKLVCKLYYNLHHNWDNKAFLMQYCDELQAIEENEKAAHHSQKKILPYLSNATLSRYTDYPVMACVIRALRSHIQSKAHPHKQVSDLQSYLNGEFLDVIKYEDKYYAGGNFQTITSIDDFVKAYTKDPKSFSLLDRVYLTNYKSKHADRSESDVAKFAMGTIQSLDSNNKNRYHSIMALFDQKAARKAEKAARPVIKEITPDTKKTSLDDLTQIIAEIDEVAAKNKEWPALSMAKK